jgi:DNA (cytosine-5)-methyltransferase 1
VKRAEKKALFTVFSTFAGGGGSSTGYRLAGGTVLGMNEFVEAARDTYRANYPNTIILPDDIRNLTGKKILRKIGLKQGELDILDGSPPCASFSMAGKREKGWGEVKKYSDTKQRVDDLFFEFARVLKELQPKVFVAENVKGLTVGGAKNLLGGKREGIFFNPPTIYKELVDCGYNVTWKVLNAAHYGVAQTRERLIFIGVRKDLNIKPSHPKRTSPRYITVKEILKGIENDEKYKYLNPELKTHKVLIELKEGQDGSIIMGEGKYFNFRRLKWNVPSPTITASGRHMIRHPKEKRLLTIKECKRIMSYPDDFILIGTENQQWERLGRSVPPLMMEAIASHIYKEILCAE